MALALGVQLIGLEATWTHQFNPSLALAPASAQIATWHNAWDNALGDTHTSPDSDERWPAFCGIWLTLYNSNIARYPQPAPLGSQFPSREWLRYMRDRGITPFMIVQPSGSQWFSWDGWNNGSHDEWIEEFARQAWGFATEDDAVGTDIAGRPKSSQIVVRFAQEMNAAWPPWATGKNGNTAKGYRNAFTRFHDIARNIAPNLAFHYCPAALGAGAFLYDPEWGEHYPGPGNCEYIGWDWYAVEANGWPSMRTAYSSLVSHMRIDMNFPDETTEPILVGETGIAQNVPPAWSKPPNASTVKARAGWINGTDYADDLQPGGVAWVAANLPDIVGIGYFQASPTYSIDLGSDNRVRDAMAVAVNGHRDRLPLPVHSMKFSGAMPIDLDGAMTPHKVLNTTLNYSRQQVVNAARALGGAYTLCPRPTNTGAEYVAVKAAAAELSGGVAHFETVRDSKQRIIRIRMGRTGGSQGDYLTVWRAQRPNSAGGVYDGLKSR